MVNKLIENTGMKVLAIITARGGSKRLPGKNIMPLGGKPLIAWTIQAALDAKCVDYALLSSDDKDICEIGKKYGCHVPFLRPADLATDEASSVDVVMHAIKGYEDYSHLILLQPTSPFRTGEDIDKAFDLMLRSNSGSCISVRESLESPDWMYVINESNELRPIVIKENIRTQNLSRAYIPNGALFITGIKDFLENKKFVRGDTVPYIMPFDRSIDIDLPQDFLNAENLITQKI